MLTYLKFSISVFILLSIFSTLPIFAQPQALQSNPDSIPFAPAVNYGAGNGPSSVFCADLDGDGHLDLAVANYYSNNVSILLNNGDGTFQNKVDYAAGNGPYSVFCADLDGDTHLDLAVANGAWPSKYVSILKNNGDGTFQGAVDYMVGLYPRSVFCADLDTDGDSDLAVVNVGSDNVSILKNNGDGTFQSAVNYWVAGDYPTSVFCADLDTDLAPDLAVTSYWTDNVSILKNNGNGSFQSPVTYGVGNHPMSVFCADLDGDGDLDLAVTYEWDNIVSILKNNGGGTFQSPVNYGSGSGAYSVFCADLDRDLDLDLAVPNWADDNVSILKNNGNGTFQTAVNYGAGDSPRSVFCADLDGDTDLDLAVANELSANVSILKNLSNQTTPGTIDGTAIDASTQQNLQDVLVEALQEAQVRGSDTTDVNGNYSIPNLTPGTYDVRAKKSGYETQLKTGQNVVAGETTAVDFQLVSSMVTHCRTVGSITICAKSIIDLGGGNYRGQDSVWIGSQNGEKFYLFLGSNAAVTFNIQEGTVTNVVFGNVHLSAKGVDYDVSAITSLTIDAQAGEVRFHGTVHYSKDAIFQSSFTGSCTLQLNNHRFIGTVNFDDDYFGAGTIGLHTGEWDLEGCPFFGVDAEINLASSLQITELSFLNGKLTIGVFLNTGIFRVGLTNGAFEFSESGGAFGLDLTGLITPPGVPSQGMIDIDLAHLKVNVVKDIPIGLPLPLITVEKDSIYNANSDLLKGKISWESIKKVDNNTLELTFYDETGKQVTIALVDIGLTIKGEEPYTDLNCSGRYDLGEPFEDEDNDGVWDEGTNIALLDDFQNPIFKAHGHGTLDLTLAKYINLTCADAVVDIDFPNHNRIDLEIWTGLKLGNIFDVDLATGYLCLDFKDRKYSAGAVLGDPNFPDLALAVDLLITFQPFEFSARIKENFKVLGVDFLATDAALYVDERGFYSSCYLNAYQLLSAQSQFAFREEEIYGSFVSDFHIDGLHLSKLNNAFYFAPHQCLSGSGGIEGCLWKLCKTIPFSYRICSFTDWKVSANGLSVGLGSPANLHVYDSLGRHTGINKQGGIDTEIPGSEFYMFRDIQQQLAFLPNLDLSGGYTIDIEGLADSVLDLNILYSNRADGNAYNVAYFERPTKKGALHRVDLNANNNWTMANDLNGDSIFENQTAPDFTAEAALDTTIVTISNVSSKTSGDSATISWHTNVPSTSKVLYRSEHDSIYQSIADTILTTSHSISVDSLSTTEIYYYVVVSIDTVGNIASFLEKSLKLYVVGDPDADRNINLADAIYLANYLLKGGPSPVPVASGDVNCDGKIDLVDVIKLARYVLFGEPFPC